ncbi:MAG: hypothetical protein CUN49_09175 [Candidatus Thermofonsia Clade 1 bacterium]|uniref:Uncharacterized protein n=1 Tax=Candidatus Thermofonsia Clade 1 bacterium TaxID=2364210 RepID=A0A2M8PDS7_9CHLR|nr:MAG: hypothetical protein CUN49_09175 [Candidatus Thermofonsia Clade 1 bacterium]PJF42391.1 MAG: hypothetical protein CUN50_04355 [Candidatus Thermofonsia Clade 1 bacterium]RMF51553.1 MAG: hypothetical protein D6749_07485 [Chloroflexota bacterium]
MSDLWHMPEPSELSEPFVLPPLSQQPSRTEVAALLSAIKHDLVGLMQVMKIGLELLVREDLERDSAQEVLALIQENVERGFAYTRALEELVRQFRDEAS